MRALPRLHGLYLALQTTFDMPRLNLMLKRLSHGRFTARD